MKNALLKTLLALAALSWSLSFSAQGGECEQHEHGEVEERGHDDEAQGRHEEDEEREEINASPRDAVAFLKEFFPTWYHELKELRENEPEAFEEGMDDAIEFVSEMLTLKRDSPKLAELVMATDQLEMEVEVLADTYHDAASREERKTLRRQLEALVARVFEKNQELLAWEAKLIEEELNGIKMLIQRQEKDRARIIDHRLEELMEEDEDDEDNLDDLFDDEDND